MADLTCLLPQALAQTHPSLLSFLLKCAGDQFYIFILFVCFRNKNDFYKNVSVAILSDPPSLAWLLPSHLL